MRYQRASRSGRGCVLLGAVVVATAAPSYAQNLLTNAGFEAPASAVTDQVATGWTFELNCERVSFAHIGNTTPGGTKIIWAKTFQPAGGGVFQNVNNIVGGTPYDLTTQVYFEEFYKDTTSTITLELIWMNNGTDVGTPARTQIVPGDMPAFGAWGPRNVNGVAPAGANQVRVALGWENGGTVKGAQSVFFDDPLLLGQGIVPSGAIWATPGSGNWNLDANWSNGVIPNGNGAAPEFLGAITAPSTVFTDIARTVGSIRFDNANTYVIAGAGSLTVQVSSGSGSIVVQQGSHKINLPLTFASNTGVTVAGGATLTLGNPTTISANQTVTKTGNMLIQAPLTLGPGASLVLNFGATTLFGAPGLGAGAEVDVRDTTVAIDYRGLGSAGNAVKAQLTTGYNAGAWNGSGINTSAPLAVGGKATGLGWRDDVANQQVLVKYTYIGDTNLDGQVDITDLGALATAWQTSNVWSAGDFNYSGFVDITDLGALATNWQAGVGNPLGPDFNEALASVGLGGVSVPEPAAVGLLGLCVAGVLARRSRAA